MYIPSDKPSPLLGLSLGLQHHSINGENGRVLTMVWCFVPSEIGWANPQYCRWRAQWQAPRVAFIYDMCVIVRTCI